MYIIHFLHKIIPPFYTIKKVTFWDCLQVIYCETQILTDEKLTSSTFPCCVFVCPSKSVTSPLFSTLWCFRPYKPYISRKLMTPTTHHMAFWVSHSLLCLSFIIYLYSKVQNPPFFKYLCNHPFDPRYYLFLFYFWAAKRETHHSYVPENF